MDTPALVALALVLTVGLASALKNWTARALIVSYAIVMGSWWVTGEASMQLRVIMDYMVLVVIFIKPCKERAPTPGALGWAKDWWFGLSWWDKAVVWLFLPSWFTYAVTMSPDIAFWIAWPAGVLQLFAAGGEAWERWRRGRAQARADNPTDPSTSRYELAANEC